MSRARRPSQPLPLSPLPLLRFPATPCARAVRTPAARAVETTLADLLALHPSVRRKNPRSLAVTDFISFTLPSPPCRSGSEMPPSPMFPKATGRWT
jgi:hypothetical protein